jgi:hypothetical protein
MRGQLLILRIGNHETERVVSEEETVANEDEEGSEDASHGRSLVLHGNPYPRERRRVFQAECDGGVLDVYRMIKGLMVFWPQRGAKRHKEIEAEAVFFVIFAPFYGH